ncbi:CUB domain-containing protein 1 [Anableps anableps]
MRLCGACALLALLFVSSLDSSESFETTVLPKKGSDVTVSSKLPGCTVCTVSGVNDTQTSCQLFLKLVPEEEVKLLFDCSQPIKQSYSVEITSLIECTKDICNPKMVEVQSSLLSEFTRTFIWKLNAPEKTLVSLDVLGAGLTDKAPHPCPDGPQYTVITSEANREVPTLYCRGGLETRLDLPNQGVVSLKAKPNMEVASVLFQASPRPMMREMTVTIGPSSTVVLSRDPKETECEVCVTDGATPDCHSTEKTLKSAEKLPLEFHCLKPQDVFTMKMTTKMECTKSSCTPASAEVDPELFKGFNKTLTWDISVPDRTVLTLHFPSVGLKEISSSENCKDGFQYTVSTTRTDGQKKATSYCKGGTVSQLELLGKTTVTVEVPEGGELDQTVFSLKAAPRRGRSMSVTSDPNTDIIIKKQAIEPDCQICVTVGSKQTCHAKTYRLKNPHNTSVEFTCPQPQNVFSVEINREIDCTETSCLGDTVHAENKFFPDFNRTFTWDLKVVSNRVSQLNFAETGLRQIPNDETCPDDHTYSVIIYLRSGLANIGTFCKGGLVTTILARYKSRVSLMVPGNAKLDPLDFQLNVGNVTDMAAIVKVSLPRGVSDTDFLTPNYPNSFPDNERMRWEFTVPGMHNYTINFLDHLAPECLNEGDMVVVEYQKEGKMPTRLTLTDPQPQHQQGSFNLVLKNCETNRTLPGLRLSYRVSVMRSGHPVLCTVDLTRHPAVSVQIEKVGSDPFCEMSINSVVKEKINVAKGTTAKLSFLDCPNDDIRLTATQVIACKNVMCSATSLFVPTLDSCLPMLLQSFTWHITIPHEATLDLVSPTGSLRQSLPEQPCDQSSSVRVAEADGYFIGDFCSNGVIQKLQVHANVSITAMPRDFRKCKEPLLNVSVSPEITETIIYNVSPKMTSPTVLATPSWPQGMKPFSTVSWIVDLPTQYKAHLQFVNVSQPKCADRHTSIKVKLLGQEEELMSRREDERAENLWVRESFYLNMSNCKPERDHFGARTMIVLKEKSNLLVILLALFGALLFLSIILVVVCIVVRKKKAKMRSEASIYMGKGNIFRPNDKHFTKTRADNDSHVYDYIDDTMVYGHLLSGSTYNDSIELPKGMQVDSYQTFTGPTDGPLPVIKEPEPEPEKGQYQTFLGPSDAFIPSRPRTPIERQDSLGFQDRRMVDNELYTFKSTGEINKIRLSGADLEPQPPIMEESL